MRRPSVQKVTSKHFGDVSNLGAFVEYGPFTRWPPQCVLLSGGRSSVFSTAFEKLLTPIGFCAREHQKRSQGSAYRRDRDSGGDLVAQVGLQTN